MLSHSEDAEKVEPLEEEVSSEEDLYFNHKVKMEVSDEEQGLLVEELGLN